MGHDPVGGGLRASATALETGRTDLTASYPMGYYFGDRSRARGKGPGCESARRLNSSFAHMFQQG